MRMKLLEPEIYMIADALDCYAKKMIGDSENIFNDPVEAQVLSMMAQDMIELRSKLAKRAGLNLRESCVVCKIKNTNDYKTI